ncbi:hypothetical protein Agub_g5022 [Astrephomene gubernaculifera]|uniref:CRAL-TRIO domain-containing protein n=1 Tax=Astrephomene gubernaculifera TaxID=47775 RepID=A0AAD3HKD4_9CHLO|nr:hypothetical protein Agub_g5022 [Astrephomene gubernaculifera]
MGLKNADLTALQTMFELLQNHYPERLGRLFLYEAPMAFYAIWRAVSPFVDPVTKTKINFVFAKNAHDEFEKVFDLHLLPRELGGEGEWHPIEEAHRQYRQQAAQRGNQAGKEDAATAAAAGPLGGGDGGGGGATPSSRPDSAGKAAATVTAAAVGAPPQPEMVAA